MSEVYKTVFTHTLKKVNLERKALYHFGKVDSDGFVTVLSLKEFKEDPAPLKEPNSYVEKEVIRSLLSQILQFNTKVEFNTWSKAEPRTFLEKVEKLIKLGARFPKKGIKSN